MKTFRLFGIIMMLVMGLSFTSCEDDERPLTGTWKGYFEEDGYEDVLVLHFNSDGSGYAGEESDESDHFTDYMVIDGTIMIKWQGDDDYDFEGYIKDITKKTFKYRYDEDEEWITFKKQ